MMWYDNLTEKIVNLEAEDERIQIGTFLEKQNLSLDHQIDYTVALLDKGRIVATGSLGGRILKCIAVDEGYKNMELSAKLVTHLTRQAVSRGVTHFFVYTKPENKFKFSNLGFYPIAEVPGKVVLLENRPTGVENYLKKLLQETEDAHSDGDSSGTIILNANPFTLGHQYLVEYAASQCETLHLFVLHEDKSSFPTEIRYSLVKEGVKHLSNVVVHMGRDYIISDATFPSYFIKEFQEVVETHARLDLELFSRYIAKVLKIKKRFVGQEPYCKVTATYNSVMQEVLPVHGIDVHVVPRLRYHEQPISASRVRKLIYEGKIDEVKKLVPKTTYQFLFSPEAKGIIQRIIKDDKRH
jgi:[citrate (pro-3S)-lyase] ligase